MRAEMLNIAVKIRILAFSQLNASRKLNLCTLGIHDICRFKKPFHFKIRAEVIGVIWVLSHVLYTEIIRKCVLIVHKSTLSACKNFTAMLYKIIELCLQFGIYSYHIGQNHNLVVVKIIFHIDNIKQIFSL